MDLSGALAGITSPLSADIGDPTPRTTEPCSSSADSLATVTCLHSTRGAGCGEIHAARHERRVKSRLAFFSPARVVA